MIIDNKGKLFGKISIVDILIVLALVGVAAGAVYKFKGGSVVTPLTNLDTLQIQFYQEEAPEYAAVAVKNGDISRDFERGSDFGKVIDVKVGDSVSWAEAANGQYVASSKDGYSSIYITVETKGLLTDTGVLVSNYDYYLGRTVILRAGKSIFYCRVSDIKKKG